MGNKSELKSFERNLKKIAREELNSFLELETSQSEDREKVLDEHIRNNVLIDELYHSIDDEKNKSQRFSQLCRDQISTAKKRAKALRYGYPNSPLPEHKGYIRLIRILEKNDELPQILDLCLQAKEQGWKGDWDGEIKRAKKLMKKQGKA